MAGSTYGQHYYGLHYQLPALVWPTRFMASTVVANTIIDNNVMQNTATPAALALVAVWPTLYMANTIYGQHYAWPTWLRPELPMAHTVTADKIMDNSIMRHTATPAALALVAVGVPPRTLR